MLSPQYSHSSYSSSSSSSSSDFTHPLPTLDSPACNNEDKPDDGMIRRFDDCAVLLKKKHSLPTVLLARVYRIRKQGRSMVEYKLPVSLADSNEGVKAIVCWYDKREESEKEKESESKKEDSEDEVGKEDNAHESECAWESVTWRATTRKSEVNISDIICQVSLIYDSVSATYLLSINHCRIVRSFLERIRQSKAKPAWRGAQQREQPAAPQHLSDPHAYGSVSVDDTGCVHQVVQSRPGARKRRQVVL